MIEIPRRKYVRGHQRFLRRFAADSVNHVVYSEGPPIYDHDAVVERMVYRDESWSVVQNRFTNRRRLFYGLPIINSVSGELDKDKVLYDGKVVRCNSSGIENNWIYLYLDDNTIRDYVFSFDAMFENHFREIQFGFRYQGFYNRYRFRIEDGAIRFDLVKRGTFINNVKVEPFEVEYGRDYGFEIVVIGKRLQVNIEGVPRISVSDPLGSFRRGGVAIILWDDNTRPLRARFADLSVRALVRA